jgi:hypothetical protein
VTSLPSPALDIALDAAEDALGRFADDLEAVAMFGHPGPLTLATLSESRRLAAGAVDRLLDRMLDAGHLTLMVQARLQHRALVEPERALAAEVVRGWARGWAERGDWLAGEPVVSAVAGEVGA